MCHFFPSFQTQALALTRSKSPCNKIEDLSASSRSPDATAHQQTIRSQSPGQATLASVPSMVVPPTAASSNGRRSSSVISDDVISAGSACAERSHNNNNNNNNETIRSPIKLNGPTVGQSQHTNGLIESNSRHQLLSSSAVSSAANNLAVNLKIRSMNHSPDAPSMPAPSVAAAGSGENGSSNMYLGSSNNNNNGGGGGGGGAVNNSTLASPSLDRREFDFSKINGK